MYEIFFWAANTLKVAQPSKYGGNHPNVISVRRPSELNGVSRSGGGKKRNEIEDNCRVC